MSDTFRFNQNIQKRADNLINSFQSSFWINEHKCFVQCLRYNRTIYLSTSSTTSNYMKNKLPDSWKSTYSNDDEQEFYNNITKIHNESFFDQSIPSHIRLPNIEYLCIKFPINDQLWSIVSSLNQSQTLRILSYTDIFQSQLEIFT
ncbi:unnamed protein product [Rotaria sordida]|uniref:Uncharacterized protein n=1 Tax=Rotaria sordida TaxID=392033 RepID=A0A814U1Q8_9BILA|nr:unnamed protein product [Rotaria sordida]